MTRLASVLLLTLTVCVGCDDPKYSGQRMGGLPWMASLLLTVVLVGAGLVAGAVAYKVTRRVLASRWAS